MAPFERATVVSYRALHCDYCTISNHSAAICHRMTLQIKSKGVGHFGANFRDEGGYRCKPNFIAVWERHGAIVCKEIVSISFAV